MPTPSGRAASGASTKRSRDDGTRARLAALVRSSADAIVGETLEGIVTDWNPAAERLYGYRAEEVIGQRLPMLVPPERLAEAEEIFARARSGEIVEEIETVRWTKDSRRIEVCLTVSPVRNGAGEIIAISAIVRDITDRKAAENALAASEALFRTAFENAPIGMILASPDLRTLQVNRALREMLGFSAEELRDVSVWSFTHPEDIAPNLACMQRALAGEYASYELEKRYIHRDGHVVWGLLSGSLVRDDNGVPRYFVSQIQNITERKAADAELAATHHHTQQVLERITESFYALDRDWRFTYVNAAAEQIFGRSRADLLGKNLWDEFASAIETPVYAAYQTAVAEGTATEVEFFYPAFNAWYQIHAYPSPDGLSVFFRDVTASRQLTEELRASEARYRTLVEQLPVVVYELAADEQQTRRYFSPYLEALTGYHPEEVLARTNHWLEDVHPEDRERVAAENTATEASGELFRVEYRMMRADGSYVWVRDECVPVHDEDGAIVAWQGVLLDISDRIAADEARARLAAIVEGADDAIVSRTLDGVITSWNRGAERLYDYRADEAIGLPFTMLLPDDLDDPRLEERRAAARAGLPVAPFETTRRRRDGTTFAASISLSPIRDRDGLVTGSSTITRDMTEQKRAEVALREALEAAQAGIRSKTLFLAMMSHELRTPLQAVLGYADFLLNGPPGSLSPEQREDVSYIRQGAGRMVALIEQMLDLSRMEAGRLELAAEAVDLAQIIEQVRQDIAPQATAKALDLALVVPAALPAALGDPMRVRQILLNLVGNAVKFTDRGAVTISARTTNDSVVVAVGDTGIGIAPEALPQIFEEFRQVDSSTTRRYGGAGLGLAISKRLAEQMGGRIAVKSQPRVGSTFTLWLPGVDSAKPRGPSD